MKKTKIITIIILLVTILLVTISPITKATISPDEYKPSNPSSSDVSKITDKANPIIGTIKTIGIIVAVVTLGVLGFKYMVGSISEKAEYKKTMIPYLIGAILVVSITQILDVIIKVIDNVNA